MNQSDQFVCANCFEDPGIQNFIENHKINAVCSFCNEKPANGSVADIKDVAEHIETSIMYEYDDAANHLGWENKEGGYIGETWDTWELLQEVIELELPKDDEHSRLLCAFIALLPEFSWCDSSGYSLNNQKRVRYSWAHFCEVVMHSRRFFFASENDTGGEIYSPGQVLEKLFQNAELYDLFTILPPGSKLFRARFQKPGTKLESAQDLGPPPKNYAIQSNRMNPPGIPMFYACDDPETALRETANNAGRFAVGCFETRRPATILDLTSIPPIPSLFQEIPDRMEFHPREVLGFLNHIAEEISKPIQRDDKIHINYIPTQVVTEFVRSKLTAEGSRIDGIKYQSAAHPGNASYVMFATQEDIFPAPGASLDNTSAKWLELVTVREYVVVPVMAITPVIAVADGGG